MLGDLRQPRWMYLKATLFLLIGLMCGGLILAESPTIKTVTLMLLMVWAFARAYYFLFYVIEHYIDADFRYSGLLSALRHASRHARSRESQVQSDSTT